MYWAEWKDKYGPVSSFTIAGQTNVILNSAKSINDLLEVRASDTADRPFRWMAILAGTGPNVFTMSCLNPWFKIYRRLLQGGFNSRACKDYRPIIQQEVNNALKCLGTDPKDYKYALHRFVLLVSLD